MRRVASAVFACAFSIGCGSFGSPAEDAISNDAATPSASLVESPAPASASEDPPPNAPGSAPSCAREHGGRTCGANGDDDCCATANQGTARIGKYMVTAGRMRAFVDAMNGDIAAFVHSLPPERWKPEWNVAGALPSDRASANVVLGPAGKKSCEQGAFTGHTYWTPKNGDDFSDFPAEVLDEKALNCVPWELLQALCIWDGGRLATLPELKAAFTNGGTTQLPWGNDVPPRWSEPDPLARLNIEGGFRTEPLPASYRQREDGLPAEVSFLIAPPGRFPLGNNQVGIADAAGNLLEFVGDAPRQFVWKGDFERHARDAALLTGGQIWMDETQITSAPWIWGENQLGGLAGTPEQKHGYYAIGGRCAF